ncbi:MAG: HupE/UreJ family protein [Zoogloeaceae bacterium]|jgi:urease accessory protein|nr:HupE/UreJ family protein [Zoogloeaceae bacterium]
MISKLSRTAFFFALYFFSFAAIAHTGHAEEPLSFTAGFLHPLTGVDHLMAMLAVGMWSAMTTRRIWVAPLSFASLLLLGYVLGIIGLPIPAVESMIAASLFVIGLLLATQAQLSLDVSAALVGVFAVFHGAAHGTELANASSVWTALLGVLAGTVLIHVAGLLLGRALMCHRRVWAQIVGGVVTVSGIGLLTGFVS